MSNFEPNAILRGAQLTLVGGPYPRLLASRTCRVLADHTHFTIAHRALQNPELFKSEHYRQAALAVVAGIAIRVIIAIPVSVSRVIAATKP